MNYFPYCLKALAHIYGLADSFPTMSKNDYQVFVIINSTDGFSYTPRYVKEGGSHGHAMKLEINIFVPYKQQPLAGIETATTLKTFCSIMLFGENKFDSNK